MIKRNETLGNIVQLIIALRDETYLTAGMLEELLVDYSLTLTTLSEHKAFIEGVWSGFTWPQEMESFFWRKLVEHKPAEGIIVVKVEDITPTSPEPILTEAQEAEVEQQVTAFALGQEPNEVEQLA
jgi:hypothetical protein